MSRQRVFTLMFIVVLCMLITTAIGATVGTPDYSPDEIIIKYKQAAADVVEQATKQKKNIKDLRISPSLDQLNNKYKVESIEPVFKNFKANYAKLKGLKTKDKNKLTKKEKHILRRQRRAPKNAKVPALDRIYLLKFELEANQSIEDVAAEYRADKDRKSVV